MHKFRIIITAGLLLGLAASANADVRIFFTGMDVNDCNEVGTCDWKLSCALGNQQETVFFSMAEANTNESVDIKRALTQKEFPPVTVSCTVMEHDGGIGAEWEQVGTGSVVVRTTGQHTLRLNQHKDEGDVTVNFTSESIGSTGQPLTTGRSGPIKSLGKKTPPATSGFTPVYAIRPNGDMLYYKHTGQSDGSPTWPIQAAQVGNGWNFRQVFAGDEGSVYAIRPNGDMLFYKHDGYVDGNPNWSIQAVQIGNGWNFKQVFAGDEGAVYAIRHNGDMLFYKHAGYRDGSANWPIQAVQIGSGWNFKQVFAGDKGAVYAIRDDGTMLFYQHAGYRDGSANWPIQAVEIGSGWNFRQVFAGGNGSVYAIRFDGDMLFYQHAGYRDGSANWPIQAAKVGNGWDFSDVMASGS